VVDSVLGLPSELKRGLERKGRSFRDYLLQAGKNTSYGRSAAEHFFQSILEEASLSPAGSASVPVREIEKKLGANSVFRTRPFQKNIQTGSFRIWSDLGKDPDWFWVMPHEIKEWEVGSVPTHARAAICEGYPSFSWFKLFGAKSREPQKLPDLISERFPEVFFSKVQKEEIRQDADLADAVVLALAGYDAFYLNRYRYPAKRDLSWEGWILGAE
jgi:hypothetical protein